MTRANLNFIFQNQGEAPRTLFHYHNGDQYPEGLLQVFGIEPFLLIDREWTPEDFTAWIKANYRQPCRRVTRLGNGMTLDAHAESDEPAEPADLGEGGQPRIYYTDGFITDYSYVFSTEMKAGRRRKNGSRVYGRQNHVTVWNWKKLIFDGSAKQFLRFCQKRAEPKILPGDQVSFAATGQALQAAQS